MSPVTRLSRGYHAAVRAFTRGHQNPGKETSRMRSRTRTWLALIAGLVVVAAPMLTAGGAQAATVQARGLVPGQCANFDLESEYTGRGSEFTSNLLDFQLPDASLIWCQELIPNSNKLVTIFTGHGDCLAFNSTNNTFYNHDPTGCGTGTAQYLVWRFISLGSGIYELQNQYDLSGRPCVNSSTVPATVGNCANTGLLAQQYLYSSVTLTAKPRQEAAR